jgi:magnesium transporter
MSLSHENLEVIAFEVGNALQAGLRHVIPHWLENLQPGDVAQIIQYLSPSNRMRLIQALRLRLDPEVLTFLDENIREEITHLLNPKELAEAVKKLDSDDAFLVIEDLDEDQRQAVLFSINQQARENFETIFSYPKDSAGRIMQREVVVMPPSWTVGHALKHLEHNTSLPENFHHVFVLDGNQKPIGFVTLPQLIRARPQESIQSIMNPNLTLIPYDMDQEAAALLFKRYTLLSAPVVDANKRLLGVITLDDIIDVIEQEAEEDIMHFGGVGHSDFYAPIFTTAITRFQWLLITFFNTLLASYVISHFQMALEKHVSLAILMPIVAAMGGNAGMQVVTVVVRALATHDLSLINTTRTIGKAIVVSSFNGLVFALILSTIAIFWFHDFSLGLVLGSAMFLNMLWAGVAGTLFPIVINRLGLDPALSAGPILTTTTDVLGFAIFLGLASAVLL